MDDRRVQLQIEVVRVTYRIEWRRRDSPTMEAFRQRARSILDDLALQTRARPALHAAVERALRELDADKPEVT